MSLAGFRWDIGGREGVIGMNVKPGRALYCRDRGMGWKEVSSGKLRRGIGRE